jgi:hypothetical protein
MNPAVLREGEIGHKRRRSAPVHADLGQRFAKGALGERNDEAQGNSREEH